MSHLRCEEPVPASPSDVVAALDRGDSQAAARALVGAAFHHTDRQAVQDLNLRLLDRTRMAPRAARGCAAPSLLVRRQPARAGAQLAVPAAPAVELRLAV